MNTAVLSADKIAFEGVRNFSPALIFDCGQCFRFDVLADGSAEGTVGHEHAKISVRGLGKIKLAKINGTTKKDRISVVLHRYV